MSGILNTLKAAFIATAGLALAAPDHAEAHDRGRHSSHQRHYFNHGATRAPRLNNVINPRALMGPPAYYAPNTYYVAPYVVPPPVYYAPPPAYYRDPRYYQQSPVCFDYRDRNIVMRICP